MFLWAGRSFPCCPRGSPKITQKDSPPLLAGGLTLPPKNTAPLALTTWLRGWCQAGLTALGRHCPLPCPTALGPCTPSTALPEHTPQQEAPPHTGNTAQTTQPQKGHFHSTGAVLLPSPTHEHCPKEQLPAPPEITTPPLLPPPSTFSQLSSLSCASARQLPRDCHLRCSQRCLPNLNDKGPGGGN